MTTGSAAQVVAHRIRELRKGAGLTLDDVSARVDAIGEQVTRHTLSKIERGSRPASVTELLLIAYALGVTPASLLTSRADDHHEVRLTSKLPPVAMTHWRRWVTGRAPLPGQSLGHTWVIDAGGLSVEEMAGRRAEHERGAARERAFPDV